MRYKILFISSWFPSKLECTNGNFVQRHAEAVNLVHEVEILHAIGDFQQKEIFVFDDRIINGIRTLIVYYKNTTNPLLNFLRRMKAYKMGFSKLQKPDIVHANVLQKSMLFAVYLKRRYKIPFVVTEHWSGLLEINRNRLSGSSLFVAKMIAKQASFILPVSQYLLNDLIKLGLKNEMKVIQNVVDTDLFKVKETQNEKFVFLHISNLIQLKNPEKIIGAALKLYRINPNFELQIGGDGDIEVLKEMIKKNNAEHYVKTFSMLTLKQVSEKMRQSDCFVLFSDYENFPCVLLESLSSGTPAIATEVGGIPEIINEKNGILISNSEDELVAAMKKMLEQKTGFDTPENLHEFVEERFSKKVISQKFDMIYQQVLKGSNDSSKIP